MALKAESFLLQALKSSSPLARKGPGKVHESIILNPNRRKNPEEPLHLEVTDTTSPFLCCSLLLLAPPFFSFIVVPSIHHIVKQSCEYAIWVIPYLLAFFLSLFV
eukprot:c11375_g2_i5.p1 GENE.c11375_g2_i5~~c11375_g2_i5.p1  ORF type:complete len:105 (+),score=17.80 c11375_g2_i5:64-378(+)